MLRLIAILSVALVLSSCRDESRTGYVELTGRVFIFNPRIAKASYVVSFGVLKDLPPGARIKAVFENPAGGDKIVVEEPARILAGKVAVESPAVFCIKKDQRYSFDVTLSDADGAVLQTISSSIKSSLDQSILPDAPLVTGNGYAPNPELEGNAAGKLPGGSKHQCPA
jgi:hypothetical protein